MGGPSLRELTRQFGEDCVRDDQKQVQQPGHQHPRKDRLVHVPGKGAVHESELTDEDRAAIKRDRRRLHHPGKATDAVWELAEEHGLCPALIEGTGHKGKVLKGDVEDALERLREKLS